MRAYVRNTTDKEQVLELMDRFRWRVPRRPTEIAPVQRKLAAGRATVLELQPTTIASPAPLALRLTSPLPRYPAAKKRVRRAFA